MLLCPRQAAASVGAMRQTGSQLVVAGENQVEVHGWRDRGASHCRAAVRGIGERYRIEWVAGRNGILHANDVAPQDPGRGAGRVVARLAARSLPQQGLLP